MSKHAQPSRPKSQALSGSVGPAIKAQRWAIRYRGQGHRRDLKPPRRQRKDAGFSLLELLITLALISMLATVVGVMVFNHFREGQIKTARLQVNSLKANLLRYMWEHEYQCPPSLGELAAQGRAPKRNLDPWGKPIVVRCPGATEGDALDVLSLGPDRKADSADDITAQVQE